MEIFQKPASLFTNGINKIIISDQAAELMWQAYKHFIYKR